MALPRPGALQLSSRLVLLRKLAKSLLVASLFPVLLAYAQRDAITIPRNLAALVGESQVVLQGRVLDVTLEPHHELRGLMTIHVTLQTEDVLKGQAAEKFSFRQAVIDPRDQTTRMGYRAGQVVLLILMAPNQYGLSAPAGLEQGRFLITARPGHQPQIANRFGNAGLFRGLSLQMKAQGLTIPLAAQSAVEQQQIGPIPLTVMKNLIRTLAAAK